ncbi:monothiol glutaredoxin grx5 [Pseudogymnoascus destructans]|uniref:Monothiol glutaredoxin grx5 n=1 Tax=Pseudogymnoascus destructans TaxID=655981 RepID=A0A176ZZS1_9PEZI|nr:monothiol glutaredoxin grx5 [Pseudogymnoascus destructans]OAF54194.2 monothiol glutaredoxin grx5 [Pseudogymnoascus destructans]
MASFARPLFQSALRHAARPSIPSAFTRSPLPARRFLSAETKTAITEAVGSAPVVLFMKGTPETPQCGFSRASIQILSLQGVDPGKFTAFNVLEDDALRSGMLFPIPFIFVDGGMGLVKGGKG